MRINLTDRFVRAAQSEGAAQADYFDEPTAGLALRVSAGGRKVWTFIFTSPKTGSRARMTLGVYPAVSLALARGRALEARSCLEQMPPLDPRDALGAGAQSSMTVGELVQSYLTKHVRLNRRSADETARRFAKNVTPIIGPVKLSELHRRDVNRVIDPILRRGSPIEATRTFEDVRAMIRWAVARGDLDRSPMDGMTKPAKSEARERVLTEAEIKTLWNGLPQSLSRSPAVQRIVKLCLVTAQRAGEVAGISRAELDLAQATWTIPGSRAKNGHEHTVPLSPLALEILQEALGDLARGEQYLFPNLDGSGSLPGAAVARTISRAHAKSQEHPLGRFGLTHWTAHDLRRTAVSNMARLGVAPIVLGHVINHRSVTKAGVTLSVYSHYDYQKEKREGLELWAERLGGIIGNRSATIVPIRGEK